MYINKTYALCIVLAIGCLALLTGRIPANADSTPTPAISTTIAPAIIELFNYDANAELNIQDKGSKQHGKATIYDFTYASEGSTVEAYLVVPSKQTEAGPAMVFNLVIAGNLRSYFIEEAIQYAYAGITSILITDPVRNRPTTFFTFQADQDTANVRQNVIALRRGVDILLHDPHTQIDPQRISYTGFSIGAYYGAILSVVEPRFSAIALLSGVAHFSETVGVGRATYIEAIRHLDAVNFLPFTQAKILIQLGREDRTITPSTINALRSVVNSDEQIKLYAAGHELNNVAQQDRFTWFSHVLGFNAALLQNYPTSTPPPTFAFIRPTPTYIPTRTPSAK